MKNIKLILEYDGTNYAGWQKQKNYITIQQAVEEAIEKITGDKVDLIGSSRTDSGVHARGFTANFHTESTIPAERFKLALNTKLPQDIVVLDSEEVPIEFHARYSCKGKMYSYAILNREISPAIGRKYLYHCKSKLDINAMREGARYIVGTHDFAAFKNTGSSVKTTVRTVTKLDVVKEDNIIIIYVSGDGFLYNMVRIIAGTLLEVGLGKREPEEIQNIVMSCNREKAGRCLPPHGLCLEEVFY